MIKKMASSTAKNIIFNAGKSNNTDNDINSQFISFRNQVYLDNMEEYYVRVYEAKIPFSTLPLFVFKPDTFSVTIGNERVFVNNVIATNNFIYYSQEFINGINRAFREAHDLNNFTCSPPYLYYDYDFDYLKIVIDAAYITSYNPYQYIPIYVNEKLILKLSGIQNRIVADNDPLGKDNEIVYRPLVNNYFADGISDIINYPCIVMTSQSKFVNDFIEYQGILIASKNIPINQQYIFSQNGTNATVPVLSFVPLELNADAYRYNYFYYTQKYPIWADISGKGKLQNIDTELYAVDRDYNLTPISLLTNESYVVRLQFIHRSLVDNYIEQPKEHSKFIY